MSAHPAASGQPLNRNAELRMLREFFYRFAPFQTCFFCGKPLIPWSNCSFGHRRHAKIRIRITMHHHDKNRDNNAAFNVKVSHSKCHIDFHAAERRKDGASTTTSS